MPEKRKQPQRTRLRFDVYYDIHCDGCGKRRSDGLLSGTTRTRGSVRRAAKEEGWRYINGKTLCPECVAKKKPQKNEIA